METKKLDYAKSRGKQQKRERSCSSNGSEMQMKTDEFEMRKTQNRSLGELPKASIPAPVLQRSYNRAWYNRDGRMLQNRMIKSV